MSDSPDGGRDTGMQELATKGQQQQGRDMEGIIGAGDIMGAGDLPSTTNVPVTNTAMGMLGDATRIVEGMMGGMPPDAAMASTGIPVTGMEGITVMQSALTNPDSEDARTATSYDPLSNTITTTTVDPVSGSITTTSTTSTVPLAGAVGAADVVNNAPDTDDRTDSS